MSNTAILASLREMGWALAPITVGGPPADIAASVASYRRHLAALARSPPPLLPVLRQVLFGANPAEFSLAQMAARALAELPESGMVDALIEAALSGDLLVARLAVMALRALPVEESNFRRLAAAAPRDPVLLAHPFARQVAAPLLRELSPWLTHDVEPLLRQGVLLGLARIGSGEVRPLVEGALADPDPEIRACAAFGLVLLGERHHSSVLVELSRHRSAEIRSAAFGWLGLLPLPEMTPYVLAGLDDRSPRARLAAIVGASEIGLPACLARLGALLAHAHAATVEQAASVVVELAGESLDLSWRGRRLTTESAAAARTRCDWIAAQRDANLRYLEGRLLTVNALARRLEVPDRSARAFWMLAGMTGQRLGYDPVADVATNWPSIERWRAWAAAHGASYDPGKSYLRGAGVG